MSDWNVERESRDISKYLSKLHATIFLSVYLCSVEFRVILDRFLCICGRRLEISFSCIFVMQN